MIEITQYAKYGGPLTKKIALGSDGTVHSDSSDCMMQKGEARRLLLADIAALAGAIEAFQPKHALSLGRLRPGLPDLVRVAAKAKLNGVERPGLIARTAGNIVFVGGKPALALLDHDCKGMPGEIAEQLREMGGFEAALSAVMPKLAESARLFRASTSAGLYRVDSGEPVPGSNGLHGYVVLADGADVERFLGALHQRCWLAGLGWHMVGSAGQLLERSIVDRIVGTPERLVFEGPPVLGPGLAQDLAARRPIISDGGMLDSAAAMPPLSIVELARLAERQAKAAAALQGEAAQARERFVSAQAERLAKHTGSTLASARRVIEQQCRGVLLPDIELPFDAPELAGKTVADVLTEPDKYIDETLADPLEGVGYGRNKAVVIRRPDGSLFIHSFAHGRTVYDLKIDGGMARAMLERAAADEVLRKFIRLMLTADLDPIEAEQLRQLTAKRAGIGVRQIDAALKAARAAHSREQAAEAKRTRLAERRDPRPQIPAPAEDAETLPHTEALNEILKTVRDPEPPMRDVTGALTRVWVRMVPSIHGLGAREDEAPPEMPLLTQLDLYGAEEQIERHVEHAVETKSGPRTVRLGDRFVRHYMRRDDRALPVVTSVATLPIVLPDRSILAAPGLHRDRGVVIRIPENLRAIAQINDR
ncbi:MAG TPA: hypothetical protein VEK82_08165, partial [Stellaceae bacterium]|nr:hypothetical protein [Stellaceae bacterium]